MAAVLRLAGRKISHGGGSLRRFISSESPSIVNNNNKRPNMANTAQPTATGNLGKQVDDKKQELIKLLDQMEAESLMTDEHKELQQLLANRFSAPKGYRREMFSGAGPIIAGFATAFVLFGR